MDEQINQIFNITINLIVTASLLFVVSAYSYISYSMYANKLKSTAETDSISEMAKLYEYDNKIVTGADIVSIIGKNVRLYRFEVIFNGASGSYTKYEVSSAKENETIYMPVNCFVAKDNSGNIQYENGAVKFTSAGVEYDSNVKTGGLAFWSDENIRQNIVGDNSDVYFSSRLIKDNTGYDTIGIQFIQGEVIN